MSSRFFNGFAFKGLFAFCLANLLICFAVARSPSDNGDSQGGSADAVAKSKPGKTATAVVAGGCFWCVETDFEKAPGVVNVISGYSGGRLKQPNYDNYKSGGHREVALVEYDPKEITYAGIVEWLVKHIDPTNSRGQFNDVGKQYSPAIYYASDEEKEEAERVLEAIDKMKVYRSPIRVAVEKREPFWPAEARHQDYHHKNKIKYSFFRYQSGRDRFVNAHWGAKANMLELPGARPDSAEAVGKDDSLALFDKWKTYEKPPIEELRAKLSSIQFRVTQQDGTETAGTNKYNKNKQAGIYVDVVSGAPLFSSADKFESGTGWPSFVAPISPVAVMNKADNKNVFLGPRIEVRSRFGDNHLGHVFGDGPAARGGKRYCMNSAAMRFIPKKDMEKEGYGEFLKFVE